jgi:uncharacterized membrane protein YgcG
LCRPGRPWVSAPGGGGGEDDEAGAAAAAAVADADDAGPSFAKIDLILYMANVPERAMTEREQEEYRDRVLGSLKGNQDLNRNNVIVLGLTIFHHNVYRAGENEKEKIRKSGGARDGREGGDGGRGLKSGTEQVGSGGGGGGGHARDEEESKFNATYPTVLVMTELDVATRLPRDVAAFFVAEELRAHAAELVGSFNGNAIFVSYFRDLRDIYVEVVDGGLSVPPTEAPTVFVNLTSNASEEEEEEEDASERRGLYAPIGIALGILWLLLNLYTWRTVHRYRKVAKEKIKVEQFMSKKRRSSLLADEERKRTKMERSFQNTLHKRMSHLMVWNSSRHGMDDQSEFEDTAAADAAAVAADFLGRSNSLDGSSGSDRDSASKSSGGSSSSAGKKGRTPKRRNRQSSSFA